MTLDTIIIAFGAFVALLPFLQFPPDWSNFFAFVAGIIIVGLGIAVRRRGLKEPVSNQATLFEKQPADETNEL